MVYLVLEMKTGCMDGYYLHRKDALEAVEYLKGEFPGGVWGVFEPINNKAVKVASIQDSKFWHREHNLNLLAEKCK